MTMSKTIRRVEATDAFGQWQDRNPGYYGEDNSCCDYSGWDFIRLTRPRRKLPSVHSRIHCGWTAAYWLREVIQKDDIPF
jgi:hypothetical protein